MRRLIAFTMLASLLAFGCKEEEPTDPDNSRTSLHIVDAVPSDTFDLILDYYNADDVVIKDFVPRRSFPIVGYADLQAGGTPDEFGNGKLWITLSRQPFLNLPPDTLMQPKDIILNKDEKSTICFADSAGEVSFLKMKDEFSFPDDVTTAVRFVNLSNAHPTASLAAANGTINIPNVAFWSNSQFMNLPHGNYEVQLLDANGGVQSTVTMWLSGHTAYTFYAVGNSLDYFIN